MLGGPLLRRRWATQTEAMTNHDKDPCCMQWLGMAITTFALSSRDAELS